MTAHEDAVALRARAEASGVFSQGQGPAGQPVEPGSAIMFAADARAMLMRKPVTAIGYAGGEQGEPRVFIYTRRRLTIAEMRLLGDRSIMASRPVFRTAHPFVVGRATRPALQPVARQGLYMACGGSISVGNSREAGTLGALLGDRAGNVFGLSCNHVTGGCSNARPGLPIVSPGILDVGAGAAAPQTIGFHARALQFISGDPFSIPGFGGNLDAAVFTIASPSAHSSSQGGIYDTPVHTAMPVPDDPVEKVGRSTGHTYGVIESCLAGAQRIDYRMTAYHSAEESSPFTGSVFFEPVYIVRGSGGRFAAEGDSGALVVAGRARGTPVAVGLVIGGDTTSDVTYMLPLPPVLAALDMKPVSGLNLSEPYMGVDFSV